MHEYEPKMGKSFAWKPDLKNQVHSSRLHRLAQTCRTLIADRPAFSRKDSPESPLACVDDHSSRLRVLRRSPDASQADYCNLSSHLNCSNSNLPRRNNLFLLSRAPMSPPPPPPPRCQVASNSLPISHGPYEICRTLATRVGILFSSLADRKRFAEFRGTMTKTLNQFNLLWNHSFKFHSTNGKR